MNVRPENRNGPCYTWSSIGPSATYTIYIYYIYISILHINRISFRCGIKCCARTQPRQVQELEHHVERSRTCREFIVFVSVFSPRKIFNEYPQTSQTDRANERTQTLNQRQQRRHKSTTAHGIYSGPDIAIGICCYCCWFSPSDRSSSSRPKHALRQRATS